jgi:hypothetical protein
MGGPPAWGLSEGLTIPHRKKQLVRKCHTGPRAGPCEHGNEPSVSLKGGEFLDQLSDYKLLKKDSAS